MQSSKLHLQGICTKIDPAPNFVYVDLRPHPVLPLVHLYLLSGRWFMFDRCTTRSFNMWKSLIGENRRHRCSPVIVGLFFSRLIGGSDYKLIYRHYATLYFVFCVDSSESELGILDLIQVSVVSLCDTLITLFCYIYTYIF